MPTYPIVGAHFRPPAKALLSVLPAGHPLTLIPEPTNEYDPNAIKVVMKSYQLPADLLPTIDDAVANAGFTLDDITNQDEWHLGYIPRDIAADLAPELAGKPRDGIMAFTMKGGPAVTC
jgi:hypothetical protein